MEGIRTVLLANNIEYETAVWGSQKYRLKLEHDLSATHPVLLQLKYYHKNTDVTILN